MHSPIVQKKLDRLTAIAKIPLPELRKDGKATEIMNEVRRIQMELLQFKSTTTIVITSPMINPDIMDLLTSVKKRISKATGEPFYEPRYK
jgi:hypothetical protein